ncbi:MAG: helix-turn-helix domain-containing protein [Planctomycetales bacterium]|jgi:repressor LexA|nr:helix-turn-helix domain-containing protein [Planctomycetales bacterium]
MNTHVGQLIREARIARGISLRALAGQVGIHFSHLSKIENGKDQIGRDSLLRVAEELGVDPDLLLGEAGHQSVPFRVLGDIAAGKPVEAIEDVETFDLTRLFDPRQHFLLRVKGHSMILDGINDGDLAIIRHANTAKNGDTVVAVVNSGEATLKRFRRTKDVIVLTPANDQMTATTWPAAQVEIRGIYVGLVRTHR